jgi:hypothetical protein
VTCCVSNKAVVSPGTQKENTPGGAILHCLMGECFYSELVRSYLLSSRVWNCSCTTKYCLDWDRWAHRGHLYFFQFVIQQYYVLVCHSRSLSLPPLVVKFTIFFIILILLYIVITFCSYEATYIAA